MKPSPLEGEELNNLRLPFYNPTDYCKLYMCKCMILLNTVKILKFGTPQTIAIIVLKVVKFDVTLH